MPLEPNDPAHLWDMLEYARALVSFVEGMRYETYLGDRKTRFAVERAVEIIGEAARRVSESAKTEHLEIPWQQIVSQRNALAHEYGEIKQERLWAVATVHAPALIPLIESILPPLPDEGADSPKPRE